MQDVSNDKWCLNDGSKISYHSFTTLADDEIELKIKRDITCKSKVDLDSMSHQLGV